MRGAVMPCCVNMCSTHVYRLCDDYQCSLVLSPDCRLVILDCPTKWSLYCHCWGIYIDHLYISHIRSQRNIVQQCTTPQLSSKQSWWCATCYTWTTDDHFEEILCAILTNGLPSSWDPIQDSWFIKFEIIPLCVECLVVLESDLEGWQ